MQLYFDFALLAFTSLFSVMNPLGILPIYTSLTSNLHPDEARSVALKAVLTSAVILVVFSLLGKFIFEFYGISVNSLRVVGGILFLVIGYDMLQARVTRMKHDDESNEEFASDIAITPLGIPLICGPGAITVSMIMTNEADGISESIIYLGVVVVVLVINFLALVSSRSILKFLGNNGNKVLMRLMGLITMVIAVEFFFSGIRAFIESL